MENNVKNVFTKGLWIYSILFLIRYFLLPIETFYDFIGAAGEVIFITFIIIGVYCKKLWRYNPCEKMPKLEGTYRGKIKYCYNGKMGEKITIVEIRQTLLNTKVKVKTDEITSSTIASSLVEENGEYILYYTYITNPKGQYSDKNPIQYGTCRIQINQENKLDGVYWTTRKTIGDIVLNKIM